MVFFKRILAASAGFVKANKRWSLPQRAPIAVLDGVNHSLLVPLFGGERYAVVDLDGGEIFCALPVVLFAAWYFIRYRKPKVAYALAVLRWIQPVIVVTYIDNSYVFQQVARLSEGKRFLAIQNGNRLLERDHPAGSPPIFLKEFACLGKYEIDQYTKHGAKVEQFYPIGMLLDSYYRELHPTPPSTKSFDLCLVSQIRPGLQERYTERLDGFSLLVKHVGVFCQLHGKSLCVAMRMHPERNKRLYEWERAWYERHLGEKAQLFSNVPGEFNTYNLTDRSRVSLGMHSTSMREAFGRGNRILSCNFSGNPVYDFPVDGLWALTDSDYEAFESRLMRLLVMDDSAYTKLCADTPRYLIGYSHEVPTHRFLHRLIAEAINEGSQFASPSVD